MVVPTYSRTSPCAFKIKLIEANKNPSTALSNQLLRQLVPRMADDMLKIVLDPLFGTTQVKTEIPASRSKTGLPVQLRYPVEGYPDD